MKRALFSILAAFAFTSSAFAGPGSGNGTGSAQLEGFDNYAAQSSALRAAISQAGSMVRQLGLSNASSFPELARLSDEIAYSKYILVNEDVTVSPNRAPGDYPVGTFLVASTDTSAGAPTRIYPRLIGDLSRTQLVQMVLHESLHRALPEPMNGYEPVVVKVTDIITQYAPAQVGSVLRAYLNVVKTKKLAWPVQVIDGHDLLHVKEAALRGLFDDNSIVETSNSARIQIEVKSVNGLQGDGGVYYAVITVSDQYRNILYSKDLTGLKPDKARAAAALFVRESLKKIQDDLSWQ